MGSVPCFNLNYFPSYFFFILLSKLLEKEFERKKEIGRQKKEDRTRERGQRERRKEEERGRQEMMVAKETSLDLGE